MAQKSPWKRAALKSLSWKITGIICLVLVSWFLGVSPEVIGKITIAYHVITLFLYVVHERIWNKIRYGKKPKRKKLDILETDI